MAQRVLKDLPDQWVQLVLRVHKVQQVLMDYYRMVVTLVIFRIGQVLIGL